MEVHMKTLTPAYGRDYKNKKEIEADFNDGKDFILSGIRPCYVNKQDLKQNGEKNCLVRYGNQRKVTTIKIV